MKNMRNHFNWGWHI